MTANHATCFHGPSEEPAGGAASCGRAAQHPIAMRTRALDHGVGSRLTPRRRRASRVLARVGHFTIAPPR
ncbi:MAG TPA: hypothetical protein P5024_04495 [Burkholderiaceae bacterium]|jgi:hypothetical protein|nr:hypothetical protein [Burkholderiaceae bacterium]HRZ00793.1 hypothetical protein [Burkholderiaceae bacterium]